MPIVPSGQRARPSATGEAGKNLAFQIRQICRRYEVEPEWYFARPARQWRFDLALPELKIAIEIEGGIFAKAGGGRHNRGAGMKADLDKYAEAALLGWLVLRVLPEWVKSGKALGWVERAIQMRQAT